MKYLLLPIFFCVSVNVRAEVYEPADFQIPKLLSFQQLMYLPADKRIEYIRDVRMVLAEVEKSIHAGLRGQKSAELETLRSTLYTMLRELGDLGLPRAEAAPVCKDNQNLHLGTCYNLAKDKKCPENETVMRIVSMTSAPDTYFCVPKISAFQPGPPKATAPDTPPKKPEPPALLPGNAPVAATKEKSPVKDQSRPPGFAGSDGKIPAIKKIEPEKKDERKSETKADEKPPKRVIITKDDEKPAPAGSKCKKRNDVRKAFYAEAQAAKAIECFNGGNISEYTDGKIRARNCKNVTEFPPDGPDTEKIRCTSGSMCHPLLYCGPSKGKAFCDKVVEDFTEYCETKAQIVKCDPFSGETAVPGAKEKWAAFKEQYDGVCGKKGKVASFKEFFCKECEIIEKRMQEIDKKYKAYTDRMPTGQPRIVPGSLGPGDGVRESDPHKPFGI